MDKKRLSWLQLHVKMSRVILLLLMVTSGPLAIDKRPSLLPGHARESISLEVLSGVTEIDSLVTAHLTAQLVSRFDVVPYPGQYHLKLTGRSDSTFLKIADVAFLEIGVDKLSGVTYEVMLVSPDATEEILFDELRVDKDWLLGTLGGEKDLAGKIVRKINKRYAPMGRITDIAGDEVHVNLGRMAGIQVFDRLRAKRPGIGSVGLLEVVSADDSISLARLIRSDGIVVGDIVQLQPRFTGLAVGMEYSHFQVNYGGRKRQAQQVMIEVPIFSPRCRPYMLRVSTGYINVTAQHGWHLLNLDLLAHFPTAGERLYLELAAGGGLSLLRLTSRVDPVTKERIKAIGMGNFNFSCAFGVAFNYQVAAWVGVGYMGFTRYSQPTGPVLSFGVRFYGT